MASAPMSDAPPAIRWYRHAQVLVVAASAVGAGVAARRMLAAPAIWGDDPGQWARLAGWAAVLALFVVWRWPRHAGAAMTLACIAAAAALMLPGPIAACALLLGAALCIGRAIPGGAALPPAIATLVGVGIAIGLFAATSKLRIHYAAVHASIAIGVLVVARSNVKRELALAWTSCAAARRTSLTERLWIVLAGVVALIHIFIAARPEAGYDASAMHLQFAEHVAADRSFRHGVDRYLWAVMPLGADYVFAQAYLLAGEAGARAINLAAGVIAASLVYRIARRFASSEIALATTTLFAAMPLALLVTSSLFSETIWVSLLLATLVVVVDAFAAPEASRVASPSRATWLPAFALLAGAAMATKVMSVVWLALLVPAALWLAMRPSASRSLSPTAILCIVAGIAIGAWPYVGAWITTGNPVFPFMNGLFASPLLPATSFNNPLYNATLTPWAPWELVLNSARFLEGRDGAMGLAWLFLLPLIALHLVARSSSPYRWMSALAIAYFILIFTQQSYLRYLLPAFALVAALASAPLAELFASPARRAVLVIAGIALLAFDLRMPSSGNHNLASPCLRCATEAAARDRFIALYAPLRAVSARLNRDLPRARVGFLVLNDATPAGYVGYSRSANWHDNGFYGLARAQTPEDILALVRRFALTHVVYRPGDDGTSRLVQAFAAKYATPLWRVNDFVVAEVQPVSGG